MRLADFFVSRMAVLMFLTSRFSFLSVCFFSLCWSFEDRVAALRAAFSDLACSRTWRSSRFFLWCCLAVSPRRPQLTGFARPPTCGYRDLLEPLPPERADCPAPVDDPERGLADPFFPEELPELLRDLPAPFLPDRRNGLRERPERPPLLDEPQ